MLKNCHFSVTFNCYFRSIFRNKNQNKYFLYKKIMCYVFLRRLIFGYFLLRLTKLSYQHKCIQLEPYVDYFPLFSVTL